jgi:hypothetical protein
VKTASGKTIIPDIEAPKNGITMSSLWDDIRMKPWNVVKTNNFNPNWGQGEFTCIHTLADKEGPWWRVGFSGVSLIITRVQILNRGDCCGGRLKGAKVTVGTELCGKIDDAPAGQWITLPCKAKGTFLKIQAVKGQYLHFCGLKVSAYAGAE